jgi:hypothetical protein
MATLPSPRNKTAKVVPGQGVKLHYLFYWHDALRQQARINHKAVSLTPQRLADFLADVHAHQRVLAQRLRDQEARGVLECLEADTARKPPEATQPAFSEAFSLEPVDLATLPVFEEYR